LDQFALARDRFRDTDGIMALERAFSGFVSRGVPRI
jgi:hypothetical protein